MMIGLPYGFSSMSLSKMQAMQLSTVYRCVEVKSDALAYPTRMVQVKTSRGWVADEDQPLWDLLNLESNPTMTSDVLFKMLIVKTELEGNGYIEIIRGPDFLPVRLELVKDHVKIILGDDGILYYIVQSKSPHIVEQSNMIHIKNFTYDGIIGVSTLTHANNTLNYSNAAEKHAGGFFKGGANMGVVIKVQGRLDKTEADRIKAEFTTAFDTNEGSPNSAAVIPGSMDIIPVGINPKDSQMLETRQFNVVDICRFFGVDPTKVFETKDSKYNTVEAMQLAWLTDTIAPYFSKIEAELNRKLFVPSLRRSLRIRYDVEDLLRADLNSLSNYRMKMFQIGGYTVNENREKVGTPKFDDPKADTPMIPS
ncbi:hypothetical protein ES708_29588 [subsurface metagenome]